MAFLLVRRNGSEAEERPNLRERALRRLRYFGHVNKMCFTFSGFSFPQCGQLGERVFPMRHRCSFSGMWPDLAWMSREASLRGRDEVSVRCLWKGGGKRWRSL